MTFFASLNFYLLLFALLIPAVILGLLERRLKHYAFLCSLIMIVLVYSENKSTLLSLLLYVVYEVVLVLSYQQMRKRRGQTVWLYRLTLFLSILPLIVVKLPFYLPLISTFGFLGISYMTFRSVQVIVDTYDGLIHKLTLYDFVSFLLFFPSISSGPIDRSKRFLRDCATIPSRTEYCSMINKGLWKLLLGLTYKFAIATFFYQTMSSIEIAASPVKLLLYAYTYGFYLFFDFAGYSLLAVGTAYLFAVRLPDNFKYPFISKDIKEFWDRWHITLSHWLRDYLFTRFIFQSIKKKRFQSKLTTATCGFLLNMFVMGIWHGPTVYYVVYGLYHGVLLSLTEVYQKKSVFYKRNKAKPWYQLLSWFLTFHAVMFGFLIFSGKLMQI